MKTILITGGEGFLGKHIVKALTEYNVIKYKRNDNIEYIFKEFEIDYIIHLSTFYGRDYRGVTEFIESNILLPLRLAEIGFKNGVQAFINTDTFVNCEQPPDYMSGYILSKKQVIEWLRLLLPFVNMKLHHVYGTGDNKDKFVPQIISSLLNNEDIPLTPGNQRRDFIYVDDVISAYLLVLKNPIPGEYQVGIGKSISISEFVLTAKELCNSKSKLMFGALPYRDNELMDSVADNTALKAKGWEPKVTLEQGLKRTINELK